MENASKALIIAGAILVSILIISLGIIVIRQATGFANKDAGLSEADANSFNTKFDAYVGNNKSAQEVRALFGAVSSNNIQQNTSEDNRCIQVLYKKFGIAAGGAYANIYGSWKITGGTAVSKANLANGLSPTEFTIATPSSADSNVAATSTYTVEGYKSTSGIYFAFKVWANNDGV